jgi:hypothetical protein
MRRAWLGGLVMAAALVMGTATRAQADPFSFSCAGEPDGRCLAATFSWFTDDFVDPSLNPQMFFYNNMHLNTTLAGEVLPAITEFSFEAFESTDGTGDALGSLSLGDLFVYDEFGSPVFDGGMAAPFSAGLVSDNLSALWFDFSTARSARISFAMGPVNPGDLGVVFAPVIIPLCADAACSSLSGATSFYFRDAVSSVPEPSTLVLLGLGAAALYAGRRRA